MGTIVDDLAAPLIMVGFPLILAWLISTLHRNRTRKKIAESGASPELVEQLYRREESPSRFAALKWGIVSVALGLGISLETVLPYDFEDPVAYGVIFVFGGAGLILYYVYVEKWLGDGPPAGRDRGREKNATGAGAPRAAER